MFERFKVARKFAKAHKAAVRIAVFFRGACFPAMQSAGNIDPELMSDEFVLGYIYGGITACLEAFKVDDNIEKGFAIQQVFEVLFPNNGQSVTEVCNGKVTQKSPEFRRAVLLGYPEMMELFESEGQKPLVSLLGHICKIYET